MGAVVGRDRELEEIAGFLARTEGGPSVLLVEGEAGIGKSTVWVEGTVAAGHLGYRVLTARPVEVETRISFAAISDLLGDVLDDVAADLPSPQRRALEVALLLGEPEGPPPTSQAIAFAFLSALLALSRSQPVLVAIDDIQWLDRPSATMLSYAVRRIGGQPIRLLLAQRAEDGGLKELALSRAVDRSRPERLSLGPLSAGAMQRMFREELGEGLTRPLLRRVFDASGGNPFYALELARALARGDGRVELGEPLLVPESLRALVTARLTALPDKTERALEIVALLAKPTVDIVAAVLDEQPELRPAIDARVVEIDSGRVVFTHPLLASALVSAIEPTDRANLHRRISGIVTDPEQRARHLAQSADGPDSEVAAALDGAAGLALPRGAPEVAAELLERALALTPHDETTERCRLLLRAGNAHLAAGDWERSRELAQQAIDSLGPGRTRAEALLILAAASADQVLLCERALAEAGDDHALRAQIGLALAEAFLFTDFREGLRAAHSAVEEAARTDEPGLLAGTLTLAGWIEGATGEGDALQTIGRAVELERQAEAESMPGGYTSEFNLAALHMWRDEHEPARDGFDRQRLRARGRGEAFGEAHALLHLAQVEWRAGNWTSAGEHTSEGLDLWDQSGDAQGRGAFLWIQAVIAAHNGALDDARGLVADAIALAPDDRLHAARNSWVLGFVALCDGQLDDALDRLETAARGFDELGIAEPGMKLHASDLIEARLAAGRVEQAETESDALVELGERLGRPRARAIGLRGRGLVLAARGDLEGAIVVLRDSVAVGEAFPVPFEHGRTLLALGTVERRAKHRREARESLQAAHSLFAGLGAPIWAARARDDLARIAGRAPSQDELTPTERRIADLVAEGGTNREVAAALFVSVHTVEAALTRVYRKLGVRSRTELANRLLEADPKL